MLQEHSTPTIIQRPEGGDMQSLITAWVETTTGRLIRAEVKTRDARIGVLAVRQHDLGRLPDGREARHLLVPYEMKEGFFAGRFREGTGTARYSNYRQFRTAAPRCAAASHETGRRGTRHHAARAGADGPSCAPASAPISTDYEPKLSELIADELFVQQNVRGTRPPAAALVRRSSAPFDRRSRSLRCQATSDGWDSGA